MLDFLLLGGVGVHDFSKALYARELGGRVGSGGSNDFTV
jgi:hypothetical protein